MSAFSFRLRVDLGPSNAAVRLVIRLARGARWAEVRPLVCAAAGLPTDTVLYHGVGPVEEAWRVGAPPLLAGCTLGTHPAETHPHRPPLVLSVLSGPDAGAWVPVGTQPLAIGRRQGADLPLTDPAVSRRHAQIHPHPAGLMVTDAGSVNGVMVDGAAVGDGALATTGSVIRLGGTLLQVQLTTEPPGGFRTDGRGHLVRDGRPARFRERLPALPPRPGAPEPPPRRSLPLLTALIGAAVGAALALVLHNTMFLAFAALGPVMMIGNALGDRLRGRRSYRQQRADHRLATAAWHQALARRAQAERRAQWRRWPGPAELARRAATMSGHLWDRRRSDADYLHVAIGHGTSPLTPETAGSAGTGTPVDAVPGSAGPGSPAPGRSAEIPGHDEGRGRGRTRPERPGRRLPLRSPFRRGRRRPGRRATTLDDEGAESARPLLVSDLPIVIALDTAPGGVLGFVGAGERAVARFVIAQLACHHSPDDLALAVMGHGAAWEACPDLPHHVPFDEGPCSGAERLPTEALAGTRDLVILLDGADAIGSAAGAALLAAASRRPLVEVDHRGRPGRLIVLAVADSAEDLPLQAVPLAGLIGAPTRPESTPMSSPMSEAQSVSDRPAPRITGYTQLSATLLADICQELAPLRDGGTSGGRPETAPPGPGSKGVTLADLGDATPPLTVAALRERWARPSTRACLGLTTPGPAAAVGAVPAAGAVRVAGAVRAAGAVTAIDLDADGPHLLIAGTTGSGKSELLQTLITSWALAAPPTAMTFLLVDYKGGAAFGAIRALPHVVGMVTDLDPATSVRALTSLRAELRRREQAHHAGGPPSPKLVLVIDEFATLAAELPDFLAGVLDIAQRGRSLGLHLVLATQRPAGVVSPAMRANISARICLRVTDPADSVDVLGIPDAAAIPADRPGQAILRTGDGFVPFRTAQVTAPPPPAIVVSGGPAGPVASRRDTTEPEADIVTAAVLAASGAAAGLPAPRRPWLAPLPTRIPSSADRPAQLARADLPEKQAQEDHAAPDSSLLIVGPPGSGRSTALRRVAEIAAYRGEELLVVDGAGALEDLEAWPQVSSYLTIREPALVLRLLALLADPGRHPANGRRRHLLIDGYDVVSTELERADHLLGSSRLGELPARTHGLVQISATGPERLAQHRCATAFSEIITLGGVSAGHGGIPAGLAPGERAPSVPGRGRWRGAEVQLVDAPRRAATEHTPHPAAPARSSLTAARADPAPSAMTTIPAPGDSALAPGASLTTRTSPWSDALVVRPLPALVPASALPQGCPERIAVGRGGDDAGPVTLDLAGEGGAILVAGPRHSGVTTALAMLAGQAAAAGIPVLRVLTRYCRSGGDDDDHRVRPAPVIDIPCQDGPEPLRAALAAHQGPVLVVADHHGLGDDHPAAEILERFLTVCGPGQHLAIGARLEVLARARRGHLRAAISHRRGLLLSPDRTDGALFDLALPPRRGFALPGRGVLVGSGPPLPVQVALPRPGVLSAFDVAISAGPAATTAAPVAGCLP